VMRGASFVSRYTTTGSPGAMCADASGGYRFATKD
jgi:hypothetical protein